MPYHGLSASKIARMVGCHPNTVRLYEKWGLIAPVPRNAKGYRLYNDSHLFQMKFARQAFDAPFPGVKIRRSTYQMVHLVRDGKFPESLESVNQHIHMVENEIARSEAAIDHVHHWLESPISDSSPTLKTVRKAAAELDLSLDQLRSWERSGLVTVPRDPHSGYRIYSKREIARLSVIRMLRNAGYSLLSILRMLTNLDHGSATDIHELLNQVPEDEDIEYASDHWLETLHTQLKVAYLLREMILSQLNGSSPSLES